MMGVSQKQDISDDADRPNNRQQLVYWTVAIQRDRDGGGGNWGLYPRSDGPSQGRSHLEQTVQMQVQLIQGIATVTDTPQTAWESAQQAYQLPQPSGMRV